MKKQRVSVTGTSSQALGSLADVFSKISIEPSKDNDDVPPETTCEEKTLDKELSFDYSKLHIRLERKGHKGKTVTVVEKIELGHDEITAFANKLKKALGCGCFVRDNKIFLQGDLVDAVGKWCKNSLA